MIHKLGQTVTRYQAELVDGKKTSKGESAVALKTGDCPSDELCARAENDSLLAFRPRQNADWQRVGSVAEFHQVLGAMSPADRAENIGLWSDKNTWVVCKGDGVIQPEEVTPLGQIFSKEASVYGEHSEQFKQGDNAPFAFDSVHYAQANLAQASLLETRKVASIQGSLTYPCTVLEIPYDCNRTVTTQATEHHYRPVGDWGLVGKKVERVELKETRETREYSPATPDGVLLGTKTWNLGTN